MPRAPEHSPVLGAPLTFGPDVSPSGSPLRFGAVAIVVEVSTRSIGELGHAGFVFRFDFALRLESAH
jgi:hypothetical protein